MDMVYIQPAIGISNWWFDRMSPITRGSLKSPSGRGALRVQRRQHRAAQGQLPEDGRGRLDGAAWWHQDSYGSYRFKTC